MVKEGEEARRRRSCGYQGQLVEVEPRKRMAILTAVRLETVPDGGGEVAQELENRGYVCSL
jgi:hypothetical protein